MHDQPTAGELIAAVRSFLAETARPALMGHAAFHARVAENVLAIVERELEHAPRADGAARKRLLALLYESDDTALDALNTQLSDAIRAGTLDETSPGLLDHLKATTIDQLKVDQPKYSGLAIAMKSGQD
ncbi:MAG: DUF6285 domain-containing protein [Pseudomonadota bacterium]